MTTNHLQLRFSVRALMAFTLVVAVFLGIRQYVVCSIHRTNDGIKLAKIEMSKHKRYSFNFDYGEVDPNLRIWLDFLFVTPKRLMVGTISPERLDEDRVFRILVEHGVDNVGGVFWFEEDDYADFHHESDVDEDSIHSPLMRKFEYIKSSSLDLLAKLRMEEFNCSLPIAVADIDKINRIKGLHKLALSGDWIRDEHLRRLQPGSWILQLDLQFVTREGLMELLERMPEPTCLSVYSNVELWETHQEFLRTHKQASISK